MDNQCCSNLGGIVRINWVYSLKISQHNFLITQICIVYYVVHSDDVLLTLLNQLILTSGALGLIFV